MNQDQFVVRRQPQWQELTHILDQMQRQGPRRLPLAMVSRLGRLYRQTASDLAYARTYFPGTSTAAYLNQLVARAHSAVYAREPQRLKSLIQFLRVEVPQAVRSAWGPFLLAVLFTLLGGLVGFFAVMQDQSLAQALVPQQILERVLSPQDRYSVQVSLRPLAGTAIMLNNVRVGVMAFGLGVTLGIGTAITLFYNGLIVGAVAAQAVPGRQSFDLWAFLLAHGALELSAIFMCGAAGLILGWAIVAPGELPRKVAVVQAGQRAVKIVIGATLFFVVAATIEGLVTPAVGLPPVGKLAVGVVTGALGWTWILRSGCSANAR